jgi:hypothetical protein
MSTQHTIARVSPRFRIGHGTVLTALGVLVAIAVTIVILALSGTNHTTAATPNRTAVARDKASTSAALDRSAQAYGRGTTASTTGGTGSDVQTGGGNYTASSSAASNLTGGTGSDVQTGGGNYGGPTVPTVARTSAAPHYTCPGPAQRCLR